MCSTQDFNLKGLQSATLSKGRKNSHLITGRSNSRDFFKHEELSCICPNDFPVCRCDKEQRLTILTKKPVTPSADELSVNYRSRSAKLRAAERV